MKTELFLLISPIVITALFLFGKLLCIGKEWGILALIKRNKKRIEINESSINCSDDILETLLTASDNYLKKMLMG